MNNKEILFISKSDNSSLDDFDVMSTFEQSDNLEDIKQNVKNAKNRLYVTWASVDAVDNAREIIPIEDVIQQQEILLRRNAPITDEHTNKVVGQTLAYKILKHPKTNTLGVLHLSKIFNDNPIDDKVWSEIVSGERTGSSVGGYKSSESVVYDRDSNSAVTALEGFNQYETASVFKPCNPFALNEAYSVVAKSDRSSRCKLDSDKSESVINNPSNETSKSNLNNKGDIKMTEEIMKKMESSFEAVNKTLAELSKSVKKLEEDNEKEEEKKKQAEEEEEEKKKQAEEEEEEKKKAAKKQEEEDDKEKEAKKQLDSKPVDGITGSPASEATPQEDNNDETVFKSVKKELDAFKESMKKEFSEVIKAATARPAGSDVIQKSKDAHAKQVELANKIAFGEVRKSWNEVHAEMAKINGGY
jgi:hypothetical protein